MRACDISDGEHEPEESRRNGVKVWAWCCDVGAAKSAAILPAGERSAMIGRDFLALIRGEALRGDESKGHQQEGEVGR